MHFYINIKIYNMNVLQPENSLTANFPQHE